MNNDNLIPKTSDQSREEAKRNGRKGGIASGKARRDKRDFRETLNAILPLQNKDKDGKPIVSPITGKPMSVRETIVMRTIAAAMNGNVKAVNAILDILGERTVKAELTGKDGKDLFASLTDEEIRERLEELDRKLS